MNDILTLKIKRISKEFSDIPVPHYSTSGSSGMDVRAAVSEPLKLEKGKIGLIPTNLILEIPSGYEIQVRPRSGLALNHGVTVLNTPGTIDSDYRGELKIIMINLGESDFTINRGDRIAQLILARVYKASVEESDDLQETERNSGGFGSSGIQ
ncbi:MAG: dUTP diphosphatase [Ignavibacteriaceae bacterium]